MPTGMNLVLAVLSVLVLIGGLFVMIVHGDIAFGIILLVVGLSLSGVTVTRSRKA